MSTGIILREDNADKIAEWCGGLLVVQHDALDYEKTTPGVNILTENGVERAQVGDLIVREHGTFRIVRQKEIGG